jgi:hypothetical protein
MLWSADYSTVRFFTAGRQCFVHLHAVCAAMANGVVALFGAINSPSSMRSIESLARTFNMPYITPAGPSSSTPASAIPALAKNRTALARNAFTLYLRPAYRNALVGLVQYYQWKKVYYIYDTNEGWSLTSAGFTCVRACIA